MPKSSRAALARNYAVCCELHRIVREITYIYDEPTVDDFDKAAEKMGLEVNKLSDDSGARGHTMYGVFYGGAFTQSLNHGGLLLAIIDEDFSGAAYVVSVYPTDCYSTAITGKFVEPLPIKIERVTFGSPCSKCGEPAITLKREHESVWAHEFSVFADDIETGSVYAMCKNGHRWFAS